MRSIYCCATCVTADIRKTLASSSKVPFFLHDFNQNLAFLDRFLYESPLPDFMEIYPVGAALICADRWTAG